MSPTRGARRSWSAVTLLTLCGILALFALVGWSQFTAPGPWDGDGTSADECIPGLSKGDLVRSSDITVSVYNAGSRSGLASQTQAELIARGFLPGDLGNAPEDLESVKAVKVLAPKADDPAATLVARQFARKLEPTAHEDVGKGVEVVVGDKFKGLVKAPIRMRAKTDGSGC